MTEQRLTLGTLLRAASHELQRQSLPPNLLADIHRTLDRRTAARAPRRTWLVGPWGWGLTTACAALVAWLAVAVALPDDVPAANAATDLSEGFVPLAASERWSQAAQSGTGAWLVSAELSHAKLAALGLPYDPGRADEPVRAQLLLHSSGDVLAVRFVR